MSINVDFSAHLPTTDGSITVSGLGSAVTIRRDSFGIPHVTAESEADVWFGQGYASAQDRLWQMEWYRRRGLGQWAEVAGATAVGDDKLFRRMRLADAGKADVPTMSPGTRAMFEAYVAGVNAFIARDELPPEFALTGVTPEPWEAWHCTMLFKVRHVLMGQMQLKLTKAKLLKDSGAEKFTRLDTQDSAGTRVILPPGAAVETLIERSVAEFEKVTESLGTLADDDGGSNSWAVHGTRTSTGKPIICNDSHRALDVPNCYWQVHLTCPEFNAAGATFAGFPGLPHFGYNRHVAWNITHGAADVHELYIEQFEDGTPLRYKTANGWRGAEVSKETVKVFDGADVEFDAVRTRHGGIVHGDPASGLGIAVRWTASDEPALQWEVVRPMLQAKTVTEINEAQRLWNDPVNNFVAADSSGNIGYQMRGRLPLRNSGPGKQVPVPGWTGEHEWDGDVPFEQLPVSVNPDSGFIATANQRIQDSPEPYISEAYAPPSRAQRLTDLLAGGAHSPETIKNMQSDVTSVPAATWGRFLSRHGPFEGDAEKARDLLSGWDEEFSGDGAEGLLHSAFRRELAAGLFEPVVGTETWEWMESGRSLSTARVVGAWLSNLSLELEQTTSAPDGRPWPEVLPDVLAAAWQAVVKLTGTEDSSAWHWGDHHWTVGEHSLAPAYPSLASTLNPPAVNVGGDSDSLRVSGYPIGCGKPYSVLILSVYRQAIDFADADNPSWVIPGGASGHPGSPHYADQLPLWQRAERVPMHITEAAVATDTQHTLVLEPSQ